jgi:hypothetical protein
MAKPAQTMLSADQIPQPYPQEECCSPAFSRYYGFRRPGATLPDQKGNLGFVTMKAPDAFAENPDPKYSPFVITRR